MPQVHVTDLGSLGIIVDRPANTLPDAAFSSGRNIRFNGDSIELAPGDTELTSCDNEQRPYHLQSFSTTAAYWWVQAGIKASSAFICAYDGSNFRTVTPAGIIITQDDQWSGGVFNGISVLHNGIIPYYWPNPNTPGTIYEKLPFDASNNWDDVAISARVIRPFKNVLFALDVTKSGLRYPHLVKWSSAADPGFVPSSWDETDTTNIAGESAALAETRGFIVDMLPLGDAGMIYKEDSIWSVAIIRGTLVMKFRQEIQSIGALAVNCIAKLQKTPTQPQHIVMGDGDIVIHNGKSAQSIIDKRNRNHVFRNLDTEYYKSSFVVAHHQQSEIWVCYPTAGQRHPNQAAIWNWKDDNWTIKDLPVNTSVMVTGVDLPPPSAPVSNAWDDQVGTWHDFAGRTWGEREFNPVIRTLVGASDSGVRRHEDGYSVDGVRPVAFVERIGLPIAGHDTFALLNRVYPQISGQGIVQFYISTQEGVDEPTTWYGPYPFEIGVDKFFPDKNSNLQANGRLHGIRLEMTEADQVFFSGWKGQYTVTGNI